MTDCTSDIANAPKWALTLIELGKARKKRHQRATEQRDRVLQAVRDGHSTAVQIGAAIGISPQSANDHLAGLLKACLVVRDESQRQFSYTAVAR